MLQLHPPSTRIMMISGMSIYFLLFVNVASKQNSISTTEPWSYVGCYKDMRPRDMTSAHKDVSLFSGMSLDRCYKFCSGYSTLYMGLQNGNECRCDNNYGRYGVGPEDDCDTACPKGDNPGMCRGAWRNSIYQIRDQPATSITEEMIGLSFNISSLVFTALGDWGQPGSGQRDVAEQLGIWSEKQGSAFTAAIGDNFYDFGVSSADDKKFKTVWKNIYTSKSLQHPWLVIEGNHDYLMGNAAHQLMYAKTDKRWVMPSLYYSMHYAVGDQNVHFIFLDTDPMIRGDEYHQYSWFRKELAESESEWIIVFGHHPVASSGPQGTEPLTSVMYSKIRPLLIKHKVALYICGHDHLLQHIADSSGVTDYVISGSGAKRSLLPSLLAKSNLKKKNFTSKFVKLNYGFAGFRVVDNVVSTSFIDRDGRELYSFTKVNPRAADNAGNVFG